MSSQKSAVQFQPSEVKQCCARLYEGDMAKLLLGDSFHPGGLKLTDRLGHLLQLTLHSRVLDVASGRGTSAVFLAERFGCEVIGIDYSDRNVEQASGEATVRGLSQRVSFLRADAELLPFSDGSFDAVVCECAFCTFSEKSPVAHEFARVLRRGGRVGLSDLTRGYELPKELGGLLAWIACIADAQPIENYIEWLHGAGLVPQRSESHDQVLLEMVRQVQTKLLGAELMAGLKKIELPGIDLSAAKQMAKAALAAVEQGRLGYAIVIAEKPQSDNGPLQAR
jgi:ubiquinone/menaquinone biosynthesis C-methylase UbiE